MTVNKKTPICATHCYSSTRLVFPWFVLSQIFLGGVILRQDGAHNKANRGNGSSHRSLVQNKHGMCEERA